MWDKYLKAILSCFFLLLVCLGFFVGRKYVSGFVQKILNKITSLIMKAAREIHSSSILSAILLLHPIFSSICSLGFF